MIETMQNHVIRLEGLDKDLSHPIRLGTLYRGPTRQLYTARKHLSLCDDKGRTIVTRAFDAMRQPIHQTEASFDDLRHRVRDHLLRNPRGRRLVDDNLSITTLHHKYHLDSLRIPTIQTPKQITFTGQNLSLMNLTRPGDMALKQQTISFRNQINPLMKVSSGFNKALSPR